MKCMKDPLSEDIIKNMHKNLKEGVFEDRANGYAIGEWKKRANRVSDIQTALPQEVPEKIHQLLEKYHNTEKITLYDIAKSSLSAHCTNVGFVKANSHTLLGSDNNLTVTVSHSPIRSVVALKDRKSVV